MAVGTIIFGAFALMPLGELQKMFVLVPKPFCNMCQGKEHCPDLIYGRISQLPIQ